MTTTTKNAKGPATVGAVPDHGSIESWKGNEMNAQTNITNIAKGASQMLRRGFLKGAVSLPALAVALPAYAEPSYTVAQHVADMEACGAYFRWSPGGLWQNMLDIDWDAFEACRVKSLDAGIETQAVWEYLDPTVTETNHPPLTTSVDYFLEHATLAELSMYHSSALASVMNEIRPDLAWRSQVRADLGICFVVGDERQVVS